MTSDTNKRSTEQPNILIIITDDQGYADLSAYEHAAEDIKTPNMDRLAGDGVLFTQAYVTAPVCSPSRAGWNTRLLSAAMGPKGRLGAGTATGRENCSRVSQSCWLCDRQGGEE